LGSASLRRVYIISAIIPPPPRSTLFPYTTLFRSRNVPGVRLGRLAVAKEYQRQGIGKTLLIAAMRKFMDIFETAGGIGLFVDARSEEHTSELQSRFDLVCRLLLEKKKNEELIPEIAENAEEVNLRYVILSREPRDGRTDEDVLDAGLEYAVSHLRQNDTTAILQCP